MYCGLCGRKYACGRGPPYIPIGRHRKLHAFHGKKMPGGDGGSFSERGGGLRGCERAPHGGGDDDDDEFYGGLFVALYNLEREKKFLFINS